MACEEEPNDPFLKRFRAETDLGVRCDNSDGDLLGYLKEYYFTPQEYPAMPEELRERVYEIYNRLLKGAK